MASGSPRMAASSAIIRNGIVFTSTDSNQSIVGPGWYSPSANTIMKKSHNSRTSDGNKKGVANANTFATNGPPGFSLYSPRKSGNNSNNTTRASPFSPRGPQLPFSPSHVDHGKLKTPEKYYSPALQKNR